MDETLLHSAEHRPTDSRLRVVEVIVEGAGHSMDPVCRGPAVTLYTAIRPHAEALLTALAPVAELILWTAGTAPYAKAAMPHLDPAGHIRHSIYRDPRWFSREYVKDLDRLGRDLDRTVIVDNSPSVLIHRQHSVVVSDFFRDPHDTVLVRLQSLLLALIASEKSVPEYLASCRAAGSLTQSLGRYHLTGDMKSRL